MFGRVHLIYPFGTLTLLDVISERYSPPQGGDSRAQRPSNSTSRFTAWGSHLILRPTVSPPFEDGKEQFGVLLGYDHRGLRHVSLVHCLVELVFHLIDEIVDPVLDVITQKHWSLCPLVFTPSRA